MLDHEASPFRLPGLEGRVAIVTGHRQGIGAAVAGLLTELGARVHGFDLPDVDLSALERIDEHVRRVGESEERIDILVNNAGITNIGSILETSLDELDRVFTLNFKAPFLLIKAVLPYMLRQRAGSIVNSASDQAFIGKRYAAAYGASKAAIAQLTRSAALDWGPQGIRVNCVAPGSTDTPMLRRVLEELPQRYPASFPAASDALYKSGIPLGRFAEPREIAWLIAFLASSASSFITGAVLPIDGGFTAA